MLMTPIEFLGLMVLLTAAAGVMYRVLRRRHVSRLRQLAGEWKLHYSAVDRFRLGPRIVTRLPVPGAAAVRVVDLIYGIERENYRYIFLTEYTTGVLRTKTGVRRVATFSEPREASPTERRTCNLTFAPEGLDVIEQYRHLLQNAQHADREPAK
jgi:hypothetical protein